MAMTLMQLKSTFQDPMRQGVVSVMWESSRIMQHLNFIQHNGLAYPYAERTRLPGVSFRGLNESFAVTAGVNNPRVETLTILGGKIRTDSVLARQKPNARQNEIAAQMEAAAKFFDKNFFHGNPATDAKSFLGLRARLAGSQVITQATDGATPTWQKVVELQDVVEGPNAQKVLFMNSLTRRNLSANVASGAGGMGIFDVGRQLMAFNGSPIVEVYKDEAESDLFPFTETCGSSNATSSMYCVRFGNQVDERYVQGILGMPETIMQAGPFDYGEYIEDVVQMVAGIGLFSGYCAGRLKGLKAA